MFLHDLCYYTMHRCQHTFAWFWAHHKFHHTDEHMNATTSFRHHWLENVYRIPFIFIRWAWSASRPQLPAWMFDVMLAWAIFTHMNLRLHLGPLTRVFRGAAGAPHPSLQRAPAPEPQFLGVLPHLDILGGTFHIPGRTSSRRAAPVRASSPPRSGRPTRGVFRDWYALAREGVRKRLPGAKAAAEPK
jgi:hypothetical protein